MAVSSSSAGPCAPRVWARGASPRATVVSKMAATPHPIPLPPFDFPQGGPEPFDHTHGPEPVEGHGRGATRGEGASKSLMPVFWRFVRPGCRSRSGHESLYHGGGKGQEIFDFRFAIERRKATDSRRDPRSISDLGFRIADLTTTDRGEIPGINAERGMNGKGNNTRRDPSTRCAPSG